MEKVIKSRAAIPHSSCIANRPKTISKSCVQCADSQLNLELLHLRFSPKTTKKDRRQKLHTHARWIIKISDHAELGLRWQFLSTSAAVLTFIGTQNILPYSYGHKNHFNWLNFHLFLAPSHFALLLLAAPIFESADGSKNVERSFVFSGEWPVVIILMQLKDIYVLLLDHITFVSHFA